MNALPITILFIMLLSMISLTFFQSVHHTDYLAHKHKSYMQVRRDLYSKLEREAFKPHMPSNKPGEQKQNPTPRTHYTSSRMSEDIKESSKLNISPLFLVGKEPNLPLQKTFTHLLTILYGKKAFFPQEGIELLVKSLIAQGKKKGPKEFTDLYPEDPALKEIFYKMLKSQTPLGDYVTLSEKEDRKPVYFISASIPLLKALFGEKITQEILAKEEENYFAQTTGSPILKEPELKELLSRSVLTNDPLSLIQFHNPTKEKTTLRQENKKANIALSYTLQEK
jgi:hypothetical protein